MTSNNNIQEELRTIAPVVANLSKNNPYEIPVGYFNTLAGDIVAAMVSAETDLIKTGEQVFTVPVGYFDGLATNIFNKINLHAHNTEIKQELRTVAPLLTTISNANLYTAPGGYFDAISFAISGEDNQTKVVSLGRNINKWVSYAAAASVLFILSTTSYFFVNHHLKGIDKSPTIEQRLATLKDDELINYLNNDIEAIDVNSYSPADTDADINHLLLNASDEEIQNYLDAENEPVDKPVKGI
jgi:hypothetical protein